MNHIEAMKQALEALENWLEFDPENFGATDNRAVTALRQALSEAQLSVNENSHAIEQAEKQVVFKIYKPTLPRGAIPNVRDAELPWVYDQDPSSGNVASMWVTPVKDTPQPQRKWVGLTDDEVISLMKQFPDNLTRDVARAIEAKLRSKNQ